MKITLNDVTNIDALSVINDNFDKIEQELQNKVLYRNNPSGEPNSISNDIDMNGNDLLNVGDVISVNGRWATIDEVEDIRDQVEADAATVAADKATTLSYRNTAQTAATDAQTAYDNFDDRYLGSKSSDPSVDNDGSALLIGALYYRTSGTPIMRVYNGSSWQDVGSITSTTTTSIDAALYPSQAEAEAGANNAKVMTPLRVKQAIDKQVKEGFTTTGPIVLPGNASTDLQAVPKQQAELMSATSFSGLSVSASGANANVTISANEILVRNVSGSPRLLSGVSVVINSASSGVNGLDSGSISASTWYSVWVIWNGMTTAGLISTSATAPTMPSGYTHKARVGWIRTDGTASKFPLGFTQRGRRVQYLVNLSSNVPNFPQMASGSVGDTSAPVFATIAVGNFVPSTAGVIDVLTRIGNASSVIVAPNGQFGGVGSSANPAPISLIVNATTYGGVMRGSLTLESTDLFWACVGGGVVCCVGWEDNL